MIDKTDSLYFDQMKVRGATEMSDEQIRTMSHEYMQYLERDDLMPRAKETAQRILSRLAFEQIAREGYYGYLEREQVDDDRELDDYDYAE